MVTKQGISAEFEEMLRKAIPVHEVIVETSVPLGKARERAIQRVKTQRFVWVDDDVWLPEGWFDRLEVFWNGRMGWLEGWAIPSSPKWYRDWTLCHVERIIEKGLNGGDGFITLGGGVRCFCCCSVVLTEAVKDWRYPDNEYLGFGSEDLLLTRHVKGKGYGMRRYPVLADHRIIYSEGFLHHVRQGIVGLVRTDKSYSGLKCGLKFGLSCVASGLLASLRRRNLYIFLYAVGWGLLWFREMAFPQ